MRIESPTYSPMNLKTNPDSSIQQKDQQQFRIQRQNDIGSEQAFVREEKSKEASPYTKPAAVTLKDRIDNGFIRELGQVLEPQEEAVLRQLFENRGPAWGVNAYETQTLTHKDFIVGQKLDIKT